MDDAFICSVRGELDDWALTLLYLGWDGKRGWRLPKSLTWTGIAIIQSLVCLGRQTSQLFPFQLSAGRHTHSQPLDKDQHRMS